MATRQTHLGYIDGLRGLAALYVTAGHACLTYAVLYSAHPQDAWSATLLRCGYWLRYGRSAVAVFIVVSGYCLMLPVLRDGGLRHGATGFLLRRARRILPPYYAAMLLSLAMISAIPGLSDPAQNEWSRVFWSQVFPAFTVGSIATHLLLIHNYWPAWQHAIDYPMWSLATEWQIYWLFPWLVAIWARKSMGHAVMCALRITLVLQGILIFWPALGDPWPPQFVALFACGMAAASAGPAQSRLPWGVLSAFLMLLYVVLEATVGVWLLHNGHQPVQEAIGTFLAGCAAACLLVHCAGNPPLARWLGARPLVWLGRFSYSLYLVHAPIVAALFVLLQSWSLSPALNQLLLLGLGIPITLALAYAFFMVFERPFLNQYAHRRAPSATHVFEPGVVGA